jgi:hypothetical protein
MLNLGHFMWSRNVFIAFVNPVIASEAEPSVAISLPREFEIASATFGGLAMTYKGRFTTVNGYLFLNYNRTVYTEQVNFQLILSTSSDCRQIAVYTTPTEPKV